MNNVTTFFYHTMWSNFCIVIIAMIIGGLVSALIAYIEEPFYEDIHNFVLAGVGIGAFIIGLVFCFIDTGTDTSITQQLQNAYNVTVVKNSDDLDSLSDFDNNSVSIAIDTEKKHYDNCTVTVLNTQRTQPHLYGFLDINGDEVHKTVKLTCYEGSNIVNIPTKNA